MCLFTKFKIKTNFFKWIVVSIFIPILVAYIASGYYSKKNIEIIYREVPIIEKFDVTDYFPLKKGNYWIYQETSRTYSDSGKIITEKYKYKNTVENIFSNNIYTIAIMSTSPYNNVIEKYINKKVYYAYLVISNKIYIINEDEILKNHFNTSRFDSSWDSIQNLGNQNNDDSNLLFEFPLYDGQQFGSNLFTLLRKDYRYRTMVKKESSYFSRINGKTEERSLYKIINSTLGSDAYTTFIPYKGIIQEFYKHHGTPEENNSELIETNVK